MANNEMKHTGFTVKGGEKLNVDGVKTVESFEPGYVTLVLVTGGMSIEGENMKIESLSQQGGELVIVGKINAVMYTKPKKKNGFLSGIFG